jgi:hypothetical protein
VAYLLASQQVHAELRQVLYQSAMWLETMQAVRHRSQGRLPFDENEAKQCQMVVELAEIGRTDRSIMATLVDTAKDKSSNQKSTEPSSIARGSLSPSAISETGASAGLDVVFSKPFDLSSTCGML